MNPSLCPAPNVTPTLEEMDDITMVMFKCWSLVLQYGAITITPPKEWKIPRLRLNNNSTFPTRVQSLPSNPAKKLDEQVHFPNDVELTTVGEYRRNADKFTADAGQIVMRLHSVVPEGAHSQNPFENVELAQAEFWKAMANGLDGKSFTVSYGVDVEAEGVYAKDEHPDASGGNSVNMEEAQDSAKAATSDQERSPANIAELEEGKGAMAASNEASGENSSRKPVDSSIVSPEQNLAQASAPDPKDPTHRPQFPIHTLPSHVLSTAVTPNSAVPNLTVMKTDDAPGSSTNPLQPTPSQPNHKRMDNFEENRPLANLAERDGASGNHIQTGLATETVPRGQQDAVQHSQLSSTPLSNVPGQVAPLTDSHPTGRTAQVGFAQGGPSNDGQAKPPVEDLAHKRVRQMQGGFNLSNFSDGVHGSHGNRPLNQIISGIANYSNLGKGAYSVENHPDNHNGNGALNPTVLHVAGSMGSQAGEMSLGTSHLQRDSQMGGFSAQANRHSANLPCSSNSLNGQPQSTQLHRGIAAQSYPMQASGGRGYQDSSMVFRTRLKVPWEISKNLSPCAHGHQAIICPV